MSPTADRIDTTTARELLADLGFLLVPGYPYESGVAYLMVALRPRPELTHYDPERIEYWVAHEGDGQQVELEWASSGQAQPYEWGSIRIVDRVSAANTFVSFGGSLAVAREQDLRVALFNSEAPIVSLGGHSEPADPLATRICAFFARLRAAAGWDARIRHLAHSLSPTGIYCAFLHDELARAEAVAARGAGTQTLASVLHREMVRLEDQRPTDTRLGRDLADRMHAFVTSGTYLRSASGAM